MLSGNDISIYLWWKIIKISNLHIPRTRYRRLLKIYSKNRKRIRIFVSIWIHILKNDRKIWRLKQVEISIGWKKTRWVWCESSLLRSGLAWCCSAACLAASVRCLRSCFEHFSSGLCAVRGVIPFQYFVFLSWIRFSVSDRANVVILWLYSEWFNIYFLRYFISRYWILIIEI